MPKADKEKLILKQVYDGTAKTGYEDQHGCCWETCWTGGTLDENRCDHCGENVSETLVCMDGGAAYCLDCLDELFDVEYVEN